MFTCRCYRVAAVVVNMAAVLLDVLEFSKQKIRSDSICSTSTLTDPFGSTFTHDSINFHLLFNRNKTWLRTITYRPCFQMWSVCRLKVKVRRKWSVNFSLSCNTPMDKTHVILNLIWYLAGGISKCVTMAENDIYHICKNREITFTWMFELMLTSCCFYKSDLSSSHFHTHLFPLKKNVSSAVRLCPGVLTWFYVNTDTSWTCSCHTLV